MACRSCRCRTSPPLPARRPLQRHTPHPARGRARRLPAPLRRCEIATKGDHCGDIVFLARMTIDADKDAFPFEWSRRQFPVRPAFAMTVRAQVSRERSIHRPSGWPRPVCCVRHPALADPSLRYRRLASQINKVRALTEAVLRPRPAICGRVARRPAGAHPLRARSRRNRHRGGCRETP